MRSNAQHLFDLWSDPTFQPIGENAPRGIVTCEPGWFLTPESTNLGAWPIEKRPVRWYQRADDSQEMFEIPNVKNISKDRTVDSDAGTCTITLMNQWMKTNFAAALANELGMPGYFSFDRGVSAEARDRWNHETNEWRDRLIPGALLRTYQGYGGFGKTRQEAIDDGDIMLTGVWIVDDVTIGAKSKLIELKCRDMASLLIDQSIYPPLIPGSVYPLRYARWVYEHLPRKDYTTTVTIPGTAATVASAVPVTFSDSSNDRWYPSGSPGSAIPSGGFVLHGHKGSDALDSILDTYWLSVGNSHPSRPFCTDFWQVSAAGQLVSQIEVTTWRGPYTMYVSIMEDGQWLGSEIVPYDFATLEAGQPGSTNTHADIPYVMAVPTGSDTLTVVNLPRSYRAQQIRVSFRGHVDSGIGQWRYRCGIREFKAVGSRTEATAPTVLTRAGMFWAAAHIRDYNDVDIDGWLIVSTAGKVGVFGDAREFAKSGGDNPSGANVVDVAFNVSGTGYWILRGDGAVTAYGEAEFFGSPKDGALGLTGAFAHIGRKDASGNRWAAICPNSAQDGYWVIAIDGRIYEFGNAAPYAPVPDPNPGIITGANSLPASPGLVLAETDGTIHVRGDATHYGNYTKTVLPAGEYVTDVVPNTNDDGYWILTSNGYVQERGTPTHTPHFGENPAVPADSYERYAKLLVNSTDDGYILVRNDGSVFAYGDTDTFGSPNTATTLRSDGNYFDLADIIKDLLLWSGFFLKENVPITSRPAVYGNIETTGIYLPEPLPPEMFDKKAPIDPIKQLKEIVGYLFFVDDQGAVHWHSPNWWRAGNFLDTGERSDFIPEVDERVQLTDYTARFSKDKERSEIIVASDEPTAGFTDTVTTRYTPAHSLLRGMVRPAMVRVPAEVTAQEQRVMAELIGLHLWFARRTGQITILANPAIGIDDQIRLFERVTGDVFMHYIRGVSDQHDLETGTWSQTLTTNWLGTESGEWAIRAADATGSGGIVEELRAGNEEQFVLSTSLATYLLSRETDLMDPPALVTTDRDDPPGDIGSGSPPAAVGARQLGLYKGAFPASGNAAFTTFEDQLLGGETVLLAETFVARSWNAIETGDGIYTNWNSWLAQGDRQAVHSVGLIPHYGPTGSWDKKKGSDAEVSAALVQGAAGDFDAHWTTFAQNLTGGLANAIIRLGWEFNGGWYAWRASANPDAFVAYWRRAADIIHDEAPGVRIDWNAAGSNGSATLRNGSGVIVGALEDAYPGDAYVDIIGIDCYDQHGNRTKENGWAQVTGPALALWKQIAASHDKPLSIPEWGVWDRTRNTVDIDNDYYITKMWEFIEANEIVYHVYFDTSASDGDHKLTTPTAFPNAAAEFASLTWRLDGA